MQKLLVVWMWLQSSCYAVTTDVQEFEAEVDAAIAAQNEVSRKEKADAEAAGSLDVVAELLLCCDYRCSRI